jgi:hypothetical protein
MTTGLSYDGSISGTTSYITQIATMAVVEPTNSDFLNILPQMITYAENRIYRDLDFVFTSASNSNFAVASGTRTIIVPPGTDFAPGSPYGGGVLVVPEQINLLTPAGSTNPDNAIRVPLTPVTKEFLDAVYGSSSAVGQPKYFAVFDDYDFFVGPYSDATYTVEIVGTYRPASMSSANKTTFISLYLPDLLIMASMVYIAAYQRNFSSVQGNDPQMPVSYETQYQTLLKSAMEEEARKKFESVGWTSQSASKFSTPSRG